MEEPDGARNPHPADHHRRDGHGERGPALRDRYPGGEWLDPVWNGVGRGFDMLDKARMLLTVVAAAVVLLYVGAKVERHMQKRQLQVLDGAAEGGEVDLTEKGRGNRS